MKRKFFTKKDLMILFSFLLLATASYLSFVLEPEAKTIIPKPEIVIPCINTLSALVCLVIFFIPNFMIPIYVIAFIQAVSTVLTGYETLGIFLFTAFIIMLFCDGFFKKNMHKKFAILFVVWAIVLLGLIPFGWDRLLLAYVTSFFFGAFYFFIYEKLSYLLSTLLPPHPVQIKESLPKPGSLLSLTKMGLTKRQAEIVKNYVTNGSSYKTLSDIYITSISTVKAEMSAAFKIFAVKNKEDLRILLLQYKISI